ncbi:MAG TPA: hypothetical protein V6D27_00640 [Vampirovibrionales bacterium]
MASESKWARQKHPRGRKTVSRQRFSTERQRAIAEQSNPPEPGLILGPEAGTGSTATLNPPGDRL